MISLLTFWLAFTNWFHTILGTWRKVNTFIVLTDFAKQLFLDSHLNLSESRMVVKPNFVGQASQNFENNRKEDHFLFIGRLSEEKGILVLLETFKNTSNQLRIAGDGPLKEKVLNIAANGSNIVYLGRLNKRRVAEELASCSALIFPSIWYEPFGLVIIEAFSLSTPVIGSNVGSIPSLILDGMNGLLFDYGDSQALLEQIRFWNSLPAIRKQSFYYNALRSYNSNYEPVENIKLLNSIYQDATIGI